MSVWVAGLEPEFTEIDGSIAEYDSVAIGNVANFTLQEVTEQVDKVVNISPENGATGVSRTPTLTFTEEGEIPANRYYQIMAVAIATQGTTPDFNEGIKVTQEWVDQENQEFTPSEQLDSDQWYAWKIVPKLMPEQAEYVETFDGNDNDPLPEEWESEVLL